MRPTTSLALSLAALLWSAALAPAQGGNTPPAGTPPPAGQGGQGSQGKGAQIKIDGDYMVITFAESDGMSLRDFIKLANTVGDKVFIFSETELQSAQDNKVSFLGSLRIRKDNFFGFVQTILYIKGFAIVLRDLKDSEIVQVVGQNGPGRAEITNAAKLVKPEEVPLFANQTGVQILTSVSLEHVNAQNAQNSLRPFFAPQASTAGGLIFGTVGNNRALLLQGYGPQVYAAYQLLKLVDIPAEAPNSEVRVVRLEHAAAEELEPLLNEILNDRNRGARGAGAVPAQGVSGAEIPGQTVALKILAHTPVNAIILSGSKDQLVDAQDLIAKLDVAVEVGGGDTSVMRLKNVLADDLQQTLSRFINEDQAAENAAAAGAAAGAGAQQRRSRKTVVIAHKESNSLLLSGTATKLAQLRKLIEQKLDARQPQVLVECAVVELSTDDLTKLGVELGFLDTKSSGKYTRPFGFSSFGISSFQDTDNNGLPDTRLPDFTNPLQGITGGIISGGDFGIPLLVNALGSDNRANILSLPSVVVNNNQNALVKTAENRPTQNVSQGNTTTQSGFSGFQDAGIELNISPSISSNNYLRLNIDLSVSRYLNAFDPTSASPGPKTTRQIKTQVTMPSGSTMVLGGVIEDKESDTRAGIPLLKDIPILGVLFRSSSSQKTKTNLYFFLTPHILDEDDFQDLADVSFRKKLEAAEYIGHRRIELIDRKWKGPAEAERLQDPGASLEDYARKSGGEFPYYQGATRDVDPKTAEKLRKSSLPAGPASPGTSSRPDPKK